MTKELTPSGWHDDASNRDAGHDELQAAVYRWLVKCGPKFKRFMRCNKPSEYHREGVEIEAPLLLKGSVLCFTDVCATFRHTPDRGRDEYLLEIFEIKPRISSVGGVIRQCKHMAILANRWRPRDSDYHIPQVIVRAVVPYDDPKISLLSEMYGASLVWAWCEDRPVP